MIKMLVDVLQQENSGDVKEVLRKVEQVSVMCHSVIIARNFCVVVFCFCFADIGFGNCSSTLSVTVAFLAVQYAQNSSPNPQSFPPK